MITAFTNGTSVGAAVKIGLAGALLLAVPFNALILPSEKKKVTTLSPEWIAMQTKLSRSMGLNPISE